MLENFGECEFISLRQAIKRKVLPIGERGIKKMLLAGSAPFVFSFPGNKRKYVSKIALKTWLDEYLKGSVNI